MTTTALAPRLASLPPIRSIHHLAFRCFDAEETRQFYEDILGMELSTALIFDKGPNGEAVDFMHLFFRMANGDFIAFFDVPDHINTDFFKSFQQSDLHVAMKVSDEAELQVWAKRLEAANVPVSGIADHDFIRSIYFDDPNGIHLEITAPVPQHDEILAREQKTAHEILADWTSKTALRKAPHRKAAVSA